jgi:hypothetical protein
VGGTEYGIEKLGVLPSDPVYIAVDEGEVFPRLE